MYGASVAELPCGSPRVRVPAEADTKTFADVRSLLITSVSAGLPKDTGSIYLIHKAKNNISLQTLYTFELDLGQFPIDGAQ